MNRLRRHNITIPLAAVVLGWFLFIPSPSWAAPALLGPGDYRFDSGDLFGGTFTIDGSGEFSEWNITFPATEFSPLRKFQSPTPGIITLGLSFENVWLLSGLDIKYEIDTRVVFPGQPRTYKYLIQSFIDPFPAVGGVGNVTAVPAPSSFLLSATGLLGLAGYRWHHRRHERAQVG